MKDVRVPQQCEAWYASQFPERLSVPANLIDVQCGKAATKVFYRQGQPGWRCDHHAIGIQVTYWPIETGDPLYETCR